MISPTLASQSQNVDSSIEQAKKPLKKGGSSAANGLFQEIIKGSKNRSPEKIKKIQRDLQKRPQEPQVGSNAHKKQEMSEKGNAVT